MVFLNENPDDMHTCNMYTVLHTRNPSNFLRTYFSIMIQCAHCTMGCVSLSDRRMGSACASSCNPNSFPFSSIERYASRAFCNSLASCCFLNMDSASWSQRWFIPHFLRFLTPSSGSFPILRFTQSSRAYLNHWRIHHTHLPRWHPCKSQPAQSKSQLANTKVSWQLAGENG